MAYSRLPVDTSQMLLVRFGKRNHFVLGGRYEYKHWALPMIYNIARAFGLRSTALSAIPKSKS